MEEDLRLIDEGGWRFLILLGSTAVAHFVGHFAPMLPYWLGIVLLAMTVGTSVSALLFLIRYHYYRGGYPLTGDLVCMLVGAAEIVVLAKSTESQQLVAVIYMVMLGIIVPGFNGLAKEFRWTMNRADLYVSQYRKYSRYEDN